MFLSASDAIRTEQGLEINRQMNQSHFGFLNFMRFTQNFHVLIFSFGALFPIYVQQQISEQVFLHLMLQKKKKQ